MLTDLYTLAKKKLRKIKKTISNNIKNNKIMKINLTTVVQGLYTEKFKTLLKEIKDLQKWKS